MITRLALENWKSHAKSEFHFRKGTNVLLGRMGAGKSSVLDALCFALYGTFPKLSRRDQAVENLASIGSSAAYASVALEFEKAGKKYSIERKIGKKISEAEARLDGKLVQKGAKAVSDYAASVLGVDYELFTRAIYSEQNRIDYLLSLNPRARKQEIDWLLGLGEFDSAREAAQAAATKLAEQAEAFASQAQEEKIEAAGKRVLELESQERERSASVERLRLEVRGLSGKLGRALEEVSRLEKIRAQHREAQSEVQRLSGASERLKRECNGRERPGKERLCALAQEKKDAADRLLEQREAARKAQISLSSAASSLAVAESKLNAAREAGKRKAELSERLRLASGGKMIETLERELAEERSEFESMVQLHAALRAQEEELQKSIDALCGAGARCPVCDSDLSGGKADQLKEQKKAQIEQGRALAAKHAQEMAAKKERLSLLEKNLVEAKSCESELKRLSKSAEDLPSLEKAIAEAMQAKEKAEKEVASLEASLGGLESALEAARKNLEEAERLERLFADLDSAQASLEAAQQRLALLSFDEKGYEQSRALAENLRVEHARAQADLSGEEKRLALVQEMLGNERKALFELRAKAEIGKRYSEAAASMAIYKNSLLSAQSEMRGTLIEEINAALAEIWPAVYPYGDYGAVKIEADGKDYRLLMEKQGSLLEVDAVASGGERACLCLALRIAFATVLTPDVSLLILDEPTHNLDSAAVEMLATAINEKIPSIVEQTFVITHDPLLGESGEGAVFRLERDKSKNESTRVS